PGNGDFAFHTKVIDFPLENSAVDMAVVEISPPHNFLLAAVAVTFRAPPDGTDVLTVGYPAPVIASAQIDQNGDWAGGSLLLKSHCNEGIISAQYSLDQTLSFELN